MAENVGQVSCPECKQVATMKADKRRFVYVDCECGIFKYQSKAGQTRIKARWLAERPEEAREFLGIEEPEAPAPDPEKPEAVTVPESAPRLEISKPSEPEKPAEISKKSPKKPGFFGSRPMFRANKHRGAV